MLDTISYLLDSLITTFLIYHLADQKTDRLYPIAGFIIFRIIGYSLVTHIDPSSISLALFILVESISFLLYCTFISKDIFRRKLFIYFLPYSIFGIENSLIALTLNYLFSGTISPTGSVSQTAKLIIVLCQLSVHLLTAVLIVKTNDKNEAALNKKDYLPLGAGLLLGNLMMACFENVVTGRPNRDAFILLGIYLVFALLLLFLYLFNSVYQHRLKENTQAFELDMLHHQQIANEKMLDMQYQLHELRHDIKHFIQAIRDGNTAPDPELIRKIDQYEKTVVSNPIPVKTPSPAMDYVLNIKRREALQSGIDFVLSINLTHPVSIEDSDLYLLMSNLLDNAIEHIGSGRRISVEIKDVADRTMIQVSNSIDSAVLDRCGHFLHREKGNDHGFGVKTIRKILERYGGVINYAEEDGELCATVLLPLPL